MSMIRTLMKYVGEYKKDSILTPLFMIVEVVMEVLIPYVTASIIDDGIQAGNLGHVFAYGGLMILLAFLSLTGGVLSARFGASASTGFARNIRQAMYEKVQTFSFSNIDKFSTAGLITRMTTDVTNLQNAYMVILRIAVRAPLMLIFSFVMCFVIHARLALIFLGFMALLALFLVFVMRKTIPMFTKVFQRYDDLNASVQENVSAIRVVKAFVREEYENDKFTRAATNLADLFIRVEKIMVAFSPVMSLAIYGCKHYPGKRVPGTENVAAGRYEAHGKAALPLPHYGVENKFAKARADGGGVKAVFDELEPALGLRAGDPHAEAYGYYDGRTGLV